MNPKKETSPKPTPTIMKSPYACHDACRESCTRCPWFDAQYRYPERDVVHELRHAQC